jgi:putative heme-binding domain-containing protein
MKSLLFVIILMIPAVGQADSLDEAKAMALLARTIDQADDPTVQAALMRGMLSGLAGRRNVTAPQQWSKLSEELAGSDSREVRELSQQLSQIFGDANAARRALATLNNRQAEIRARRTALRSLLMQQNEQVSSVLESLLDEPPLRVDAIRGYASIENPRAAKILLDRYRDWQADDRRAVIETLATRKGYAEALLAAIKKNAVSRDDIPAHVARSLSLILGEDFVQTFGDVRQLAKDREKMLTKYKAMLTDEAIDQADVSRGRSVFQKTCASCHILYGTGGKIGPDLTGSNRANLDYILLNSVDPSYDVPEGYQMVMIQTVDGRLINGVIAEEDNQRVILKTVEQPTVVIAKNDIEARRVSPKSMMPDGQLDQMKPQEVIDLIKYLRTTEQAEMPK